MWKLLPVCLLVACAANDPHQTASDGNQPAQDRIVRQTVAPLASGTPAIGSEPSRSTFQRQGMRGWLDVTGAWHLRREVEHGRLRCATYQAGLQLGRGDRSCAGVEWLTEVRYLPALKHCNRATRLHEGNGRFTRSVNGGLETVNCVRVQVRCEGAC